MASVLGVIGRNKLEYNYICKARVKQSEEVKARNTPENKIS